MLTNWKTNLAGVAAIFGALTDVATTARARAKSPAI